MILRALVNLEAEGADTFFGEPELEPKDLMRVDAQGRGIITPARAGRPGRPAGDVLDVPDVGARRPVHHAARGRRRRQAEAGVLLRRGPPAVHRRVEGVPGAGRADRQADPLEGRRRVLLHAAADRCAQRRAVAAGCAHSARAARVHPRRPEGAGEDGPHLPENRCLRPGVGVDVAGHRRGDRHRALGEGCADAGGVDQDAGAAIADGHHRPRRDRRRGQGQPAAGRVRPDRRPRVGLRAPQRQAGAAARDCAAAAAGAGRHGGGRRRGRDEVAGDRRARLVGEDDGQPGVQERDALGGHRHRPRDHPQHLRHRPPQALVAEIRLMRTLNCGFAYWNLISRRTAALAAAEFLVDRADDRRRRWPAACSPRPPTSPST